MKYTDPIVIQDNEVHSMVLKKIKPGSKVLEFGAASGRMTKYLKEMHQCDVYIVEIDKASFELAMKYADCGMCADIEKFEWEREWQEQRFDYILFMDVLEHLKKPTEVLRRVENLLQKSGIVFASIPNVGHNDILLRLYEKSFKYTDEGLLDKTHIHFWAENDLQTLIDDTDFYFSEITYKTIPTGGTEQYAYENVELNANLRKLLLERCNGEVYQFLLEMKKKSEVAFSERKLLRGVRSYPLLRGKVYFDYGDGFTEKNTTCVFASRMDKAKYALKLNLKLDKWPTRVRVDFVEDMQCAVLQCEVSSNGELLVSEWSRCIENICGGVLLAAPDPYVIWKLPESSEDMIISGEIVFSIDEYYIERCMFEALERRL